MSQELLDSEGFRGYTSLARILEDNTNPDLENIRPTGLKPPLFVHATLLHNVPKILQEGLQPQTSVYCRVWGEYPEDEGEEFAERLRREGKYEETCEARQTGVYFYDDVRKSAEQAIETAKIIKTGEPTILVTDLTGIKAKPDPEMHTEETIAEALWEYSDEPLSIVTQGGIPPERIKCVCTLYPTTKDEMMPKKCDPGSFLEYMAWVQRQGAQLTGLEYDLRRKWEDPSNWSCNCREDE